jgi:hypothetical protein
VVGRAKMYMLNLNSPVVMKFIELDNAICELYRSRLEEQDPSNGTKESECRLRPIPA